MASTVSPAYLGIDVSKTTLELSALPGLSIRQLPNTPAGLRRLVHLLTRLPLAPHVVCEASGGYQDPLLQALWTTPLLVSVLNPRRVRHFAIAQGLLAKTDRIDAQVLADFGSQHHPRPTPPPTAEQQHLRALMARRRELQDALQREQARAEHHQDPWVLAQARRHRHWLQGQLDQLTQEVQRFVQATSKLSARSQRLQQVQGIGPLTAWALLATLPELGQLQRGQPAALAGLAPYCDDSGPRQGPRHLAHGRVAARAALYMPAVVASRHNPVLRALYQRLIAKGKPPKVALSAVMRRLVELANHLLADPHFTPIGQPQKAA